MNNSQKIDEFQIIKTIGKGRFCKVFQAKEISTENIFALKQLDKNKIIKLKKENEIQSEKLSLNTLTELKCIPQFFSFFEDQQFAYFQLQHIQGIELFELTKAFGIIGKAHLKNIFFQILNSIEQIHSKGIVHRDIKPENIMLSNGEIKIIDFGSSKNTNQGLSSSDKKKHPHFVGTANYMAPECIRNKNSGFSCDIYSLGCTIYSLKSGRPPFVGPTDFLIFQSIENECAEFVEEIWEQERDLQELLEQMMCKKEENRIQIAGIRNSEYFKQYQEKEYSTIELDGEEAKVQKIIDRVKQNKEYNQQEIQNIIQAMSEELVIDEQYKKRVQYIEKQAEVYFQE